MLGEHLTELAISCDWPTAAPLCFAWSPLLHSPGTRPPWPVHPSTQGRGDLRPWQVKRALPLDVVALLALAVLEDGTAPAVAGAAAPGKPSHLKYTVGGATCTITCPSHNCQVFAGQVRCLLPPTRLRAAVTALWLLLTFCHCSGSRPSAWTVSPPRSRMCHRGTHAPCWDFRCVRGGQGTASRD